MTKIERVIKVVDLLIFEKKVSSRRELADKLGYTESSMSQILNGKVSLSDKFIKKLSIFEESINEVWLMTGEGSMLLDSKASEKEKPEHTAPALEKEGDDFLSLLQKKDEQIDRMLTLLENQQKTIDFLTKKDNTAGNAQTAHAG